MSRKPSSTTLVRLALAKHSLIHHWRTVEDKELKKELGETFNTFNPSDEDVYWGAFYAFSLCNKVMRMDTALRIARKYRLKDQAETEVR